MHRLRGFFDIRSTEIYRVSIIASLLFLLLAANNLIKIVRDSVFLGHHSVSELPYLYILVAVVAGTIVTLYSKLTANFSLRRLILTTNCVILSNLAFFWFLLTYFDPGWSHYAFYVWSAIAGAIAVAQAWTYANEIFTSAEGERIFGLVAAGGTIGGAVAGFGAAWAVGQTVATNNLLWFVAALFSAASVLVFWADRKLQGKYGSESREPQTEVERGSVSGLAAVLGGSRYIKTMALLILLSVIVSTLIDFEFKAAAKQAHSSEYELAAFFSAYYGWLSIATFLFQTVLTSRILSTFGLFPSLYLTPGILLTGSLSILISPTLLAAALTRISDAALRNSVHRASMEILYTPLSAQAKKIIKTFFDVVIERTGDAAAGLIILLFTLLFSERYVSTVHVVCAGLIFIWILLIPVLRIGDRRTNSAEISSPSQIKDIVGRRRSTDLWESK